MAEIFDGNYTQNDQEDFNEIDLTGASLNGEYALPGDLQDAEKEKEVDITTEAGRKVFYNKCAELKPA